ncbi:dihydrodipicolinate reductase [Paracoccus sediminicola]|uniref:dihydrodipicolinate reductase n=1 Tax=Paracoccus sediminicola TaxID=3017783 RepID=UPI0022F0A498|nr:dihydrodipicolinate reductase [Paracoccus sediminicola]WBU56413.1 dihydrodipicolinate reductase [Paracoccus sediminicola]
MTATRRISLALLVALTPALAQAAERITSREGFLSAVEGRTLSRTGISLSVLPDGRITGSALGASVSGSWDWQSGWFCRKLAWGSREWARDCQLVQIEGDRIIFTAGKGAGDQAVLTIR